MAGIDEVLERLVADGDFRAALARDPAAALADYHLTRDELELLASRLDDSDDAERTVEQRTSKSAMFALLTSLAGPGGGGTADPGHDDQIEVLSWSWGETQGDAPDDLAVPDEGADELYNKFPGKVEYTWKIEEGVKAEVDADALTHKIEPGDTGPGAPSTDDQGIIIINGLEDDGTAAPTESVGLNYNKSYYGEVEVDPESLDPALADVGDEPEEATEVFLKLGDIKGEAQEPATSPADDPMDLGGVKAEIDPDALTHKVDPGGDGDMGTVPPDDGVVGGIPPDDNLVGATPPDDGIVGAIPPDDGVVGGTPPDDNLMGANPPDDNLGARTDVTAAMDADDVMEIEDV